MLTFHSGTHTRLEVFPEPGAENAAVLRLISDAEIKTVRSENRARVSFAIGKHTDYLLDTSGAAVRLLYLTDCEDLFGRGICLLPKAEPKEPGFTFSPLFGRFLAPLTFCFFEGRYHMFYTCDLFENGQSYLCHAVSGDNCNWCHLPVTAAPAREMCRSDYRTGGISDGGIEVFEDFVRLYYMQTVCERESGRQLLSYPVQTESRDMRAFAEETPLRFSEEAEREQEGLCVAGAAGEMYLTRSGCEGGHAALFLYRKNSKVWEAAGPPVREKKEAFWHDGAFFGIGRTHAAIGTFGEGSFAPTRWQTGSLGRTEFRVRHRGTLDFGGDLKAPRTFSDGNRRILLGKIGERLSYPREITAKGGCLFVNPAREVYERLGELLYEGDGNVTLRPKDAAYAVEITFCGETESRLRFGEGKEAVLFESSGGICTFGEGRTYKTTVQRLFCLVFKDGAEVFINGGETAGTREGYAGGIFSASFSASQNARVSVWALLPLEEVPQEDSFLCGETFEF